MIKAIEFPNRTFSTKEELFAELKQYEKSLIESKCATVYNDCLANIKHSVTVLKSEEAIKSGIRGAKSGYIYPIVSTTKFYDSHRDVHFDGCFQKTVREQQGKVAYCLDHELKYDQTIVFKEYIKMFVSEIEWSTVGKSYPGKTQALILEIKEEDFKRKDVLADIKNSELDFENSVRMLYVDGKLKLAVDSTEKQYAENKIYFDSRINEIANKDEVYEVGYFWGVEELRVWKEASLVVGGGSNSATSIYQKEITEPPKGTQQNNEGSRQSDTIDLGEFKELLSKHLTN